MPFLGFGSSSTTEGSASKPVQTSPSAVNPLNPNGVKPCCACPETKSARDECFFKSSPDEATEACKELIAAHKACMAGFGFKV